MMLCHATDWVEIAVFKLLWLENVAVEPLITYLDTLMANWHSRIYLGRAVNT